MKNIQVSVAQPDDEPRVIETLMQAFADDPAARWMYPDPQEYHEYFPHFIRAFGGRAFQTKSAHCTPHAGGAALWLPPGIHPDDDGVVDLIVQSVPEREQDALFRLFEEMGRYHPDEPHWHLPLIGVRPQDQGRGYGSALLHHALATCDEERMLAYLESSNVKNIALYQRHGFEVLGTIQVGSSPPVTPMLRYPH